MLRSLQKVAPGAILLFASAATAQAGALEQQGSTLFKQRCAMCHMTAPGAAYSPGPHLTGVVGRSSGAAPGFSYSAALAKGKLRWDAATLDAFLKAPAQRAPGTTMPIGVPAAQDRKAIIAYLATLKDR